MLNVKKKYVAIGAVICLVLMAAVGRLVQNPCTITNTTKSTNSELHSQIREAVGNFLAADGWQF